MSIINQPPTCPPALVPCDTCSADSSERIVGDMDGFIPMPVLEAQGEVPSSSDKVNSIAPEQNPPSSDIFPKAEAAVQDDDDDDDIYDEQEGKPRRKLLVKRIPISVAHKTVQRLRVLSSICPRGQNPLKPNEREDESAADQGTKSRDRSDSPKNSKNYGKIKIQPASSRSSSSKLETSDSKRSSGFVSSSHQPMPMSSKERDKIKKNMEEKRVRTLQKLTAGDPVVVPKKQKRKRSPSSKNKKHKKGETSEAEGENPPKLKKQKVPRRYKTRGVDDNNTKSSKPKYKEEDDEEEDGKSLKKEAAEGQLDIPSEKADDTGTDLCGGKNAGISCKETGLKEFPCVRCQLTHYCSHNHRHQDEEHHKKYCKTLAKIEEITYDEEYSVWRKYSTEFLYDRFLNFVLVWPSLTVEWFPQKETIKTDGIRYNRRQLLMGTQADGETNHLIIAAVDFPIKVNSRSKNSGNLLILQRINHEGEVHRARYMPQNSNIIATKSPSNDVFIFNCTEYPELPVDETCQQTLRLRGHSKDGFGLSWDPHSSGGRLVSGSLDGLVCLWDINAKPFKDGTGNVVDAYATYKKHTADVEDVNWNPKSEHIIASVGDDKRLIIWDTRTNLDAYQVENAHDSDVNCVAFSPFSEHILVTGGGDKVVALWDMRRFVKPIHSFPSPIENVLQVQWGPDPGDSSFFATSGSEKKVNLWNTAPLFEPHSNFVKTTNKNFTKTNDPSFVHGGHTASINDIAWCPGEDRTIASVSSDNILQVWQYTTEMKNRHNKENDENDFYNAE